MDRRNLKSKATPIQMEISKRAKNIIANIGTMGVMNPAGNIGFHKFSRPVIVQERQNSSPLNDGLGNSSQPERMQESDSPSPLEEVSGNLVLWDCGDNIGGDLLDMVGRFIAEGGINRNAEGLSYAIISFSWIEQCSDGVSFGNLGSPLVNAVVFRVLFPESYGDMKLPSSTDFQRETLECTLCLGSSLCMKIVRMSSAGFMMVQLNYYDENYGSALDACHCILREIKLLQLLQHPDVVEIKNIVLPPSRREFKEIFVVFELMESDLHQVIKANDDLTPEHYQFFLYQFLRALKLIYMANVFHQDLKPKNILANADCKLKICDFELARVSFNDAPSAIFWIDYVASRWYRTPEL
ncbi:hypothetical protein GIB67_015443 [Kingdonia uniflora]|uniref:Protein kinase domain-containing protein n=1 Tax=Kingdonia uniflora TaxID=39325 RepID=A0A7J7KYY8_9MAGN|nr:hypothetical protein GIB67_015443 [Kingdonia uniflora]